MSEFIEEGRRKFEVGDKFIYSVSDALCHHRGKPSTYRDVEATVSIGGHLPKMLRSTETPRNYVEISYLRYYFSEEKGVYESLNTERIYDMKNII